MKFPVRPIKSIKAKSVLKLFTVISMVIILITGILFIEKLIDLQIAAILLLILSISLTLILSYFLKNQLKNDFVKSSLKNRVDDLKYKLDEALKNEAHKTIYLTNMSYEIRTPLNTIIGMLNMLKNTDLDNDQRAQLEIADYSSEHLMQLVNMILENSKVDAGVIKLNLKPMDLKVDLTKLFKVFEYQAWEKALKFDYRFLSEKNDKFRVIGDSIRIQQVLINLINNAIKFTNSGKISIIVDQSVGIDDEQIITFYIKDTGAGIRSDIAEKIFNESETNSIENDFLKDYRGRGIGLSISRQLIKLMGGELKLESKENEGSTFYFSLQLKKTLNIKTDKVESKPLILNKFNVLVAEDNRMNQKVIKFLLEQQGVDCTFVKNGYEAVELYKILDFNMIFMDIYMPDMDGYAATLAIKKTEKYAKHKTPIIAVSASAFEQDIANAKLIGIDDFLAKPIEVSKLKELLTKYAGISKAV